MTNLEFYRDEIIDKYVNRNERKDFDCILCEVRNKTYDCRKPCYQCLEESFDWLLEEHKEPIKLKQWEYDLLFIYSYDSTAKFEDSSVLSKMKENGHFKSITDTSMALEEIVNNCEVVE